jgi:phage tail-like protein
MPLLVGTPRLIKQKSRFIVRVEAANGRALLGGFSTCSELSAEVQVSSQRFGGSMLPTKAPSLVDFADITLERGATQNADLWLWFAQTVAPTPAIGGIGLGNVKWLDIIEQDRDRSELNKWRVINCFPSKYAGSLGWDNDDAGYTIEALTLTFDVIRPIGLPNAVSIDHLASTLP